MDSEAQDAQDPCVIAVLALSKAARADWEAQFRLYRRTGEGPELGGLKTRLETAVVMAGASGTPAHLALRSIYPIWLRNRDASVAAQLNSTIAISLLEIENRLSRGMQIRSETEEKRASFQRQAALIDLIGDDLRHPLIDDLMESLLEAEVQPCEQEGGTIWGTLARAFIQLEAAPCAEQVHCLPLTPQPNDLALAADLTNALVYAVDASPPRIWRFADDRVPTSLVYTKALEAPLLAAQLLEHLGSWARHQGLSIHGLQMIQQRCGELTAALERWLTRSSPDFRPVGVSLERQFAGWQKHVQRARAVKAEDWGNEWFSGQYTAAIEIGGEMTGAPGVNSTSIIRFASLCLSFPSTRLTLPAGKPSDWHIGEAKRAVALLSAEEGAGLLARLEALQSGGAETASAAQLASWLQGQFKGGQGEQAQARRTLEAKESECVSTLARWIISRAITLLDGKGPPPLPHLGIAMEEDRLVKVIVNYGERARWLGQISGDDYGGGEWDTFLMALEKALVELFGRGDSAIDIVVASRLARAGQLEPARRLFARILETDKRPRTQAICEKHLGLLAYNQNPGDAGALMETYQHFLRSWKYTCDFKFIPREAIGTLLDAAKLAINAGWSTEALGCLRKVRCARNGNELVDQRPWVGNQLRIEAIARWSLTRRPSSMARELRSLLLDEAVTQLIKRQVTFTDDNQDLVQSRRVVAVLASGSPGNHQVPHLVRVTPGHRLHALAVAFHHDGSLAIDNNVLEAAIGRLGDTPEAATFICAWLVQCYFEESNFKQRLNEVLCAMRERTFGEAAVEQLRWHAPTLMAQEIAARCADTVRDVVRAGPPSVQVEKIERLMRGGMVRRLQPRGYDGAGNLFADGEVLRALTDADLRSVNVPRGLWVEALFGARALEAFNRHLRFRGSAESRTSALQMVTRRHEALLGLQLRDGFPCLTYEGTIVAREGLPEGTWRDVTAAWATSFGRSVTTLSSRRANVPKPVFEITHHNASLSVRVSVTLWRPQERVEIGPAATLHGILDRHYGLHLARLSGRAPGDVSRAPTSTLHDAIGTLRTLAGFPKVRQDRLRSRAIVNSAAKEILLTVRFPAERTDTDVFEVLNGVIATCRAGNAPEVLRNVKVTLPAGRLRLTLKTLLENGVKACGKAGGEILVRSTVDVSAITLVIDAPYLGPEDYPTGMGIGVESVTSFVEFYGGALQQGKVAAENVWRAQLRLPTTSGALAKANGDIEATL